MTPPSQPIAKLTMPQMAAAIQRERLFAAIDHLRSTHPLIWIAAPGGAGKTVLASTYVRHNGLPCLWFQLDGGDADPSSFFHYLGQAVATVKPRQRESLPLFTAEYHSSAALFARRYFEALGRRLKPSTVLVFDNGEAPTDNAALWPLLAEGLRALPPGMTVLFTSRHAPPPPLASLRINGHLATLGGETLKVTAEEATAIGARQGHTPATARQLNEQSNGWMAGLIVMLEQRRHGGDLATPIDGSPQLLFDFFSHDIFMQMPEAMRELLLRTAFLPGVTVAAAQHLSGDPDAGRLLEQLCRNNLFTERHDGSPAVYQYHPLFRQFLIQQCHSHYSAGQLGELQRASAKVLAEVGDSDAAIRLLAEAGALAEALALLLRAAPELISQGRHQSFLALRARLPDALAQQSPWCLYWHGMAVQPFEPGAARGHFSRAFELFREAGERDGMLRCWSALVESMFLAWDQFQQIDPWIAWLDEQSRAPVLTADPALELQVASTMTMALTMRGGAPEKMRYWAERALRALAPVKALPLRLGAILYCTNYVAWVRPLDLDTTLLESSVRDAQQAALPPLLQLTATYTRAALSLHRAPAMDALLEEVHAALALAQETGVHVWDEILCGLGVHCAVMLGDRSAAQSLVERMGRCVSPERKQGMAFYYYISAWAALACGATAEARALIGRAMTLYAETGYEFPSNVAYYGAAIICAEHGELDTALAYARQADAVAEKFQALAMRHSTLLTLAYVHHRRGERAAALRVLAEALHIGRAGGYYLTLWWWHAPMMAALAELALREGIEVDHVTELVRRLKLTPADPATAPEAWPWPLRIDTLGPFEASLDGQPLDSGKKPGQKPLALLKLLAASSAGGLPASQMADLLWPGSEGDKAHHALEMALHRARKMVGSDEAILMRNGWLRLNPALCQVDSHAFSATIDAGLRALQQGRPQEAMETLERALALYQGHLLAGDRYADQVAPARERLWTRYLAALERLCTLYEDAGEIEKALDHYRRACELDELAEAQCRHYMRYCLQLGRDDEARRAYARLERAMQQALRTAPAAATRALLDPVTCE